MNYYLQLGRKLCVVDTFSYYKSHSHFPPFGNIKLLRPNFSVALCSFKSSGNMEYWCTKKSVIRFFFSPRPLTFAFLYKSAFYEDPFRCSPIENGLKGKKSTLFLGVMCIECDLAGVYSLPDKVKLFMCKLVRTGYVRDFYASITLFFFRIGNVFIKGEIKGRCTLWGFHCLISTNCFYYLFERRTGNIISYEGKILDLLVSIHLRSLFFL